MADGSGWGDPWNQLPADPAAVERRSVRWGERVEIDPESLERGLVGLVLAVVELLRQLMERQALRRVEVGDLGDEQIERLGATLMALEKHMTELRQHFGLTPEDLNIDLGPLGSLLSNE